MKRMIFAACVFAVILCSSAKATSVISDDFEDGWINPSLWVVGGGARGYDESQPIGTGPWNYSHEEVTDPTDGHLKMRVHGPTSGMTYGAEAWVRTKQNFNDGQFWTINFTWEPEFDDWHYNAYYIQITDGYIPEYGCVHWPNRQAPEGTDDLLWNVHPKKGECVQGKRFERATMPGKLTWSITIDPYGEARLHAGPNGMGYELDSRVLDPSYPWYVRFMAIDATSAGFPSGDARLKLYDFQAVPEPTTVMLLGLGGLAVLKRRA